MKKCIVWNLLLLSSTLLWSQLNWQKTFFSGQLPDQTVQIRTQAAPGSTVQLLTKGAAGVHTAAMNPLNDGYDNHQLQVPLPSYPYLGFRCETGSTTEILPVFHNSANTPSVNDLTPLFDDPVGDCAFTNTNLDIVKTSAAFTNDKLHFAIKNAGGGFPISSGFTFFAYMIALVDPATAATDTLVFALMHTVTITGIIGPGLYKLTGTGISDMTLIGPITTTTYAADNILLLSCNLSDLMADPDFSNWYNPNAPKLGFLAMTNRITLSIGTEVADESSACNLIPYPIQINQTPATLPVLSNIQTETTDDALQINLNYQSQESYLPVTTQVLFDTGFTVDFEPSAFPDFDNPVPYAAQVNLSDIQGWTHAELKFSPDNISFTNEIIYPTTLDDNTQSPVPPALRLYPNPTNGCLYINLGVVKNPVSITIYDIKGRKLDESVINSNIRDKTITYDLNAVDKRPDGIYLIRIQDGSRSIIKKVMLMN